MTNGDSATNRDASNSDGVTNPFSPEEAPGVSLIVLMRIYDVLMGMYSEMNENEAEAMLEAHAQGTLIGPTPAFNGRFVSDETLTDAD